jgi:peptidoglycan/xylan/chitin deacetylase (PgdA/CDA1 family)
MWNIDHLDWADPKPESITQRVLREVETGAGGIILMHDVQARAVDALPRIIGALKQRGYAFLRWDGTRLAREAAAEGRAT